MRLTHASALIAMAVLPAACVTQHDTRTSPSRTATATSAKTTPETAPRPGPAAAPAAQVAPAPAAPKAAAEPAPAIPDDDTPRMGAVQVRFGIAPGDYADADPGVLVGDVFEGTSAHLAGLRPGDRMTKWNGKPIPDVEGWMPFLAAAKPGDVVEVTFVRDGKEQTTKVTLQPR